MTIIMTSSQSAWLAPPMVTTWWSTLLITPASTGVYCPNTPEVSCCMLPVDSLVLLITQNNSMVLECVFTN